MSVLRDVGSAVLWLVVALVVAIGAAGIVSGVGGPPGTSARPELTWAGDQELRADIRAAKEGAADLAEEIEALGDKGREALTYIAARDVYRAQTSVDEGTAIAERIGTLAEELRTAAAAMPGSGATSVLRYDADIVSQRALVQAAASATGGTRETWQRFSVAAVAAQRLAVLLTLHDERTGVAVKHALARKWDDALAALDGSDATMAEIDRLHGQLSTAADTTVLGQWIERHIAYDTALRKLYGALQASKGRVNSTVKAAYAAEQDARALLPADTRALSVIMAEVAQAGLQQAVVSIGEARIRLDEAIAGLDAEA